MEAMYANVSGIQCDDKECDFIDESIKFQEYREWLNKPCPKCGTNLLTEEDFDAVKRLVLVTSLMGDILPKVSEDIKEEGYEKLALELDGKGNFSKKED